MPEEIRGCCEDPSRRAAPARNRTRGRRHAGSRRTPAVRRQDAGVASACGRPYVPRRSPESRRPVPRVYSRPSALDATRGITERLREDPAFPPRPHRAPANGWAIRLPAFAFLRARRPLAESRTEQGSRDALLPTQPSARDRCAVAQALRHEAVSPSHTEETGSAPDWPSARDSRRRVRLHPATCKARNQEPPARRWPSRDRPARRRETGAAGAGARQASP